MAWPNDFGTLPTNMQGTTLLADANDGHALMHAQEGSFINAAGSKLGLSSGTPSLNQILVSPGGGSAIWNGTWNQASLGSVTATGGTFAGQIQNNGTLANGVYGTALHLGGTLANGVIGTPTINGVLYPTAAPSAGQVPMATNAGTATWQAPMFFATSGTQADTNTTSSSLVDITGAVVTFTPPRAVTAHIIVTGNFYDVTGTANDCTFALLVNGTIIQQNPYRPAVSNFRANVSLSGQSSMGATLGTVKVQYKVTGGDTLHADQFNVNVMYG